MLRHRGRYRTASHNLRLAATLSYVAGMVNICGVLAIHTLTTNVTGHFAFFAEELIRGEYRMAFTFLIYMGAFLAGAFFSGLLTEFVALRRPDRSHVIPVLLETVLLLLAGLGLVPAERPVLLGSTLLLAMGMQNALVTRVSSAVVRTTHLTGLFTDLGIELSQVLFRKNDVERRKLRGSLLLRSMIILSFFSGCVVGGFTFQTTGLASLQYAAVLLVVVLLYDNIRYRFYFLRRKFRSGQAYHLKR